MPSWADLLNDPGVDASVRLAPCMDLFRERWILYRSPHPAGGVALFVGAAEARVDRDLVILVRGGGGDLGIRALVKLVQVLSSPRTFHNGF